LMNRTVLAFGMAIALSWLLATSAMSQEDSEGRTSLEILENAKLFSCIVDERAEFIGVLETEDDLVPLGAFEGYQVARVEDGFTFSAGSDFALITPNSFSAVVNGMAVNGTCQSADAAKRTVLIPLLERVSGDPVAVSRRIEEMERASARLQEELDRTKLERQALTEKNPEIEHLKASLQSTLSTLKVANAAGEQLRADLQAVKSSREALNAELLALRESEAAAKASGDAIKISLCGSAVVASLDFVDNAIGPASGRPTEQDDPKISRAFGVIANVVRSVCQ
jgi:hypothetical protein